MLPKLRKINNGPQPGDQIPNDVRKASGRDSGAVGRWIERSLDAAGWPMQSGQGPDMPPLRAEVKSFRKSAKKQSKCSIGSVNINIGATACADIIMEKLRVHIHYEWCDEYWCITNVSVHHYEGVPLLEGLRDELIVGFNRAINKDFDTNGANPTVYVRGTDIVIEQVVVDDKPTDNFKVRIKYPYLNNLDNQVGSLFH